MTFADLFTSWNNNNNSGWKSPKYDALIKKAMDSVDQKERLDAMAAAEKILVEEAPILPYFQQARVYVQDPRLVGVLRRTVGPDPDFYYAKLSEPVAQKQ
jgi:oligopeptide transport system substrate-binding protein